jgi:hypothetical protein
MPNHAASTGGFFSAEATCKVKWNTTPRAIAIGPDPSALRFDDRLDDCQTHAGALRLRRKECVEYLVDQNGFPLSRE